MQKYGETHIKAKKVKVDAIITFFTEFELHLYFNAIAPKGTKLHYAYKSHDLVTNLQIKLIILY